MICTNLAIRASVSCTTVFFFQLSIAAWNMYYYWITVATLQHVYLQSKMFYDWRWACQQKLCCFRFFTLIVPSSIVFLFSLLLLFVSCIVWGAQWKWVALGREEEFNQDQHSMYTVCLTWALYYLSPSTATIRACSTPPACILIMYAVTAGVLQIRVFLIRLPPENLNPGTLWARVLSSNCKFITTTAALSIQSMHV